MKGVPLAAMAALSTAFAGISAAPAAAQDALPRIVSIPWMIVEASENPVTQEMAKNKPLRVAKAQAQGLIVITQPAVRSQGMSTIPAGTLFARSAADPHVACEPGRRPGQDTITCLADTDGDGEFDHFGRVQTKFIGWDSSTSIGYLVGPSAVPVWASLGSKVSATAAEGVPPAGEMNLELTLTSLKGGWIGRGTMFNFCSVRNEGKNIWGAAINVPYCTDELVFPEGKGQQRLGFMPSGSLSIVSLGKSSAVVVLDPPKVGTVF